MADLWSTLLPLIVASALVPVQITLTVLLLRSSVGTAAAWVGGMTATRLAQGLLFGVVFAGAGALSGSQDGPGPVVSVVLLVVALLFLTKAAKLLLGGGADDEDAQPPKWMKLTGSVTVGKAFLFGAAYVAIAAKLWVFTLGAIGAIDEAGLGERRLHRSLRAVRGARRGDPDRVRRLRGAGAVVVAGPARPVSAWLEKNNRVIVIVLGFVFGAWFLLKALQGLGVL